MAIIRSKAQQKQGQPSNTALVAAQDRSWDAIRQHVKNTQPEMLEQKVLPNLLAWVKFLCDLTQTTLKDPLTEVEDGTDTLHHDSSPERGSSINIVYKQPRSPQTMEERHETPVMSPIQPSLSPMRPTLLSDLPSAHMFSSSDRYS